MLNLQKSRYGSQYYVNFGVLFRELEDLEHPRPAQCHIVGRPAMLIQEGEPSDYVIDLGCQDSNDRVDAILQCLEAYVVPFLRDCQSRQSARKTLKKAPAVIVSWQAQRYLSQRKRDAD